MSSVHEEREPVEVLAEEFLARRQRGETPSLTEYIDRYPQLADEIREVFPALVMMDDLDPRASELSRSDASAGSGGPLRESLRQLGDYRIVHQVGQGGMGIVFEAEQVSLGRRVALKVLPNKLLLDAKQKRRFDREARAAAKLHHTNIVPVFGVGEHDGLPYYVMQFIQGLGLDVVLDELRRLKGGAAARNSACVTRSEVRADELALSLFTRRVDANGGAEQAGDVTLDQAAKDHAVQPSLGAPPPCDVSRSAELLSSSSVVLPGQAGSSSKTRHANYWHSIAHIGVQVAGALDYAHRQGILHRDVKPSNLLLDQRGNVWVTDFGLAKADDNQNLTHTGDVLGTLRYMPPEAFEGKSDARGDVYSLGLTLYELLVMQPAYNQRDRQQLIKHVTGAEAPSLDSLSGDIPRDLVTIVHKAIERAPAARYQTAAELAADLQRFLDDEPIKARQVSRRERLTRWAQRNPRLAALSAVTLSLLVVIAVGSTVAAAWLKGALERAVKAEGKVIEERDAANKSAELAKTNEGRAKDAERATLRRLAEARLAQADANRLSGRQGHRFKSLEAVREAMKLTGPSLELRNLALACLCLPDVAVEREWPGMEVGQNHNAAFDDTFERYARWDLTGAVSIRRIADDVELMQLPPHDTNEMHSGSGFSPCGKYFAQVTATRSVISRIDGKEPVEKWRIEGEFNLVFRHDKPQVAVYPVVGNESRLCDLDDGKEIRTLPLKANAFHPSLPRLAGRKDNSVVIVDVDNGDVLAKWPVSAIVQNWISWHPDGSVLAVTLDDLSIQLCDAMSGRLICPPLVGHKHFGVDHAFSAHGDVLLSNDWSQMLHLWDTRTGREIFRCAAGGIMHGHFSADDRLYGGIVHDGKLQLLRLTKGAEHRMLTGCSFPNDNHYCPMAAEPQPN